MFCFIEQVPNTQFKNVALIVISVAQLTVVAAAATQTFNLSVSTHRSLFN